MFEGSSESYGSLIHLASQSRTDANYHQLKASEHHLVHSESGKATRPIIAVVTGGSEVTYLGSLGT